MLNQKDLSPPLFIAECFLKLLLLKRRWHKRSAVTEEFYIQLCTYNSLPAKAWCSSTLLWGDKPPFVASNAHSRCPSSRGRVTRCFLKTPPLQEDIAGEQCLRRREIYLPQGVRQGRHQAQAKRCDGGVLHSVVYIELPPWLTIELPPG